MERVLLNEELLSELRSIRRSKDYSQEYMAAAMNISQNSYSRLESGQTEMTISRLLKISEILDIELCYFPPGGGGIQFSFSFSTWEYPTDKSIRF